MTSVFDKLQLSSYDVLDEIEKSVSLQQYESFSEILKRLEPIKALLRSITAMKQKIVQYRDGMQSLSIDEQFDEWLKCGDTIVNEEDCKSYTRSNQNQWNVIGLSMQVFVAFQSVVEMMKEVELYYKNYIQPLQYTK